jgi:hypothetical protein
MTARGEGLRLRELQRREPLAARQDAAPLRARVASAHMNLNDSGTAAALAAQKLAVADARIAEDPRHPRRAGPVPRQLRSRIEQSASARWSGTHRWPTAQIAEFVRLCAPDHYLGIARRSSNLAPTRIRTSGPAICRPPRQCSPGRPTRPAAPCTSSGGLAGSAANISTRATSLAATTTRYTGWRSACGRPSSHRLQRQRSDGVGMRPRVR